MPAPLAQETAPGAGAAIARQLKTSKSIYSHEGAFANLSKLARDRLLYEPVIPKVFRGEIGDRRVGGLSRPHAFAGGSTGVSMASSSTSSQRLPISCTCQGEVAT